MTDSVRRFDRTVENYVKYRPHYPYAVVEYLQSACQLTPGLTVADIASGTGFVAEIFLQHDNPVIGIEPNAGMRAAGQSYLSQYPRFTSLSATAEATTLDAHSVDMITAGQAFHWFDREKARQEFIRILKPEGWVVLIWNLPRRDTPFMAAYEQIWLKYLAPQMHSNDSDTQVVENELRAWYSPGAVEFKSFDNFQVLDLAGLRGRVLSSSYSPTPEQPSYVPMLTELEAIFHAHQADGKITVAYECRVCYGQLL